MRCTSDLCRTKYVQIVKQIFAIVKCIWGKEVGSFCDYAGRNKARSLHGRWRWPAGVSGSLHFLFGQRTRTHAQRVFISEVNVLKLVGMTSCGPGFRRAAVFGLCLAVGMLASCAKKPAGKRYQLEGRVVAVD